MVGWLVVCFDEAHVGRVADAKNFPVTCSNIAPCPRFLATEAK